MPPKGSKGMRYGRGRMGVIALRDTIRAEMDRGRPLRQIYEEHQSELEVTYEHFTRVVRRYVDAIPVTKLSQPSHGGGPPSVVGLSSPLPPEARPGPPPGSREWRRLNEPPDSGEQKEVFVTRVPNDDELFGSPKSTKD